MRHDENGRIRLSASDLMRFQSCAHASALDLAYLKDPHSLTPAPDSEDVELVKSQGIAHERAFHQQLKDSGKSVEDISQDKDFSVSVAATIAALKRAPDCIYQAALGGVPWGGYADFLNKSDEVSDLGPFSYTVADTKLARSVNPKHILQLVLYSDLLEPLQGKPSRLANLMLGDGTQHQLTLTDYKFYARHARSRLERFIAEPWSTEPEPVAACSLRRWRDHCRDGWESNDSITLVAGVNKSQRRKLAAACITTIAELATSRVPVAKLAPQTLEKLRTQAALQHARRSGGAPTFKLKPLEPGRGLYRLPAPNADDLFFDMEGDPHMERGLEYLFGARRPYSCFVEDRPRRSALCAAAACRHHQCQ